MTRKYEWWVKPKSSAILGGMHDQEILEILNPQWERLIRRGYVAPFRRIWQPAPPQTRWQAVTKRFVAEVRYSYPKNLIGGFTIHPAEDKDGEFAFRFELLLPPDQHEVLLRIVREELGSEGEPLTDDPIMLLPLPR